MDYIFDVVLSAIGLAITYYLVPWIKTMWTDNQISKAVAAAEQLYKTGVVSDRLEYAITYLESKGIAINTDDIEAAVYWLADTVTGELEAIDA